MWTGGEGYRARQKRKSKRKPKPGIVYYGKLDKSKIGGPWNQPKPVYRRTTSADNLPSGPSAPPKHPLGIHEEGKISMVELVRQGKIIGNAAEEILRKAKCLAPAYNKGAYQYIGSHQGAQDAGRKK